MSTRPLAGLLVSLSLIAGLVAQRVVTFERLDVADTPVGFAAATLDPPGLLQTTACEARVETAQVRYRWDGGTVSATTGLIAEVGDVVRVGNHADAEALQFVKTGSTTALVQGHCWRGDQPPR